MKTDIPISRIKELAAEAQEFIKDSKTVKTYADFGPIFDQFIAANCIFSDLWAFLLKHDLVDPTKEDSVKMAFSRYKRKQRNQS